MSLLGTKKINNNVWNIKYHEIKERKVEMGGGGASKFVCVLHLGFISLMNENKDVNNFWPELVRCTHNNQNIYLFTITVREQEYL